MTLQEPQLRKQPQQQLRALRQLRLQLRHRLSYVRNLLTLHQHLEVESYL